MMRSAPARRIAALAGFLSSAGHDSVTARSRGHHLLSSDVQAAIASGWHTRRCEPLTPMLSLRCIRCESTVRRFPAPTRSHTMDPTPARCLADSQSTPARWCARSTRHGMD